MSYKWIGAILIILGCGGFGLSIAASQRREEASLRRLISALDYMECDLQYRLTPLPELCRQAGRESHGCVRNVLLRLAEELESQISPDVANCMRKALSQTPDVSTITAAAFSALGQSLGRFDLDGQLKGLESVRALCRRELEKLQDHQEVRLRSYRTLGFCAGAAVAILFI